MLIFQAATGLNAAKHHQDFGREALALFDRSARRSGGIHSEDRHGVRRFFHCTTLGGGCGSRHAGRFRHAEEVANVAATAKHAKQTATGWCATPECRRRPEHAGGVSAASI